MVYFSFKISIYISMELKRFDTQEVLAAQGIDEPGRVKQRDLKPGEAVAVLFIDPPVKLPIGGIEHDIGVLVYDANEGDWRNTDKILGFTNKELGAFIAGVKNREFDI